LLLALIAILTAALAHHGEWSDSSDGADLLELVEVTAVRLFDALQSSPELERRAAFCAVAPLLRADLIPSVSVSFVQRLLELPAFEREDLLRNSNNASPSSSRGRSENENAVGSALASCTGKSELYPASGLASTWAVEELLLILKVLQPSLSSLHVVEMLDALLVDIERQGGVTAKRAAWEDALRFAKADLVNAVRNPVELRDVPDALLPRCQSLASNVLSTLYIALNPSEAAANQHADEDGSEFDEEGMDDVAPVDDGMVFDATAIESVPKKRNTAFGAVDWAATL
jgi:hypothetical protein